MQWFRKKKTMLVGIDVTHAGPGSRAGTPSIAAVVANIDDSFVQFPASLRIQKHFENKEVCGMFVLVNIHLPMVSRCSTN
jgi:eukaryotic translation initiation factor 2C